MFTFSQYRFHSRLSNGKDVPACAIMANWGVEV